MNLDKEHKDLNIFWNSNVKIDEPTTKLIDRRFKQYARTTPENIILNADDSTELLQTLNGHISVYLDKNNTSFDFANKFKEFLLNGEFKENKNLINFISNSSNDIGKLIYERIQNFILNNVNVDSCHYLNLISEYKSINIDVDEMFIKGIPDNLHYIINILSLPKEYYKSLFYNLYATDKEISEKIEIIQNTTDLEDVTDALNRKYFDNFYEHIAYPIIRSELFANKDDEKIAAYIKSASGDIYRKILTNEHYEFLIIKLLTYVLDDNSINNLGNLMLCNFLMENPSFVAVKTIPTTYDTDTSRYYISIDYFSTVLKNSIGYMSEYSNDDTTPKFDMTNMIYGVPDQTNINFSRPTYIDVYSMFETFATNVESFLEILNIRLVAKKLANACNSICSLRQEIKLIKERDSKVGTALLIEELISDFIFKSLTKKIGLNNQKMVPGNLNKIENQLMSLNDSSSQEALIKETFTQLFNDEQKAIGVEFEKYYNRLSNIARKLNVEIIEYYDTTSSYLNIIPEIESVKQKKFYTKRVTQCPPYLNINNTMVYSDYDNPNRIIELDSADIGDPSKFIKTLHQCATGSDGEGYVYYFNPLVNPDDEIDNTRHHYRVEIKNLHGYDIAYAYEEIPKSDGFDRKEIGYIVQPKNSYNFVVATNMNRPDVTFSNEHRWFQFMDTNDKGKTVTKIIDTYDRLITWTKRFDIIDSSNNSIMVWEDGIQDTPLSYKYIIQNTNTKYTDYESNTILSASTSKSEYIHGTDSTTYYGLFVEMDSNKSVSIDDVDLTTMTLKSNSEIKVLWIACLSVVNDQISEIFKDSALNLFVKLLSDGTVVDGIGGSSNSYVDYEYWKFVLDETGEVLNCTPDYKIFDSTRLVLNYYKSDMEKFYKFANCKVVFKNVEVEVIAALDGNTAFWNDISSNIFYSDRTVDEEANIIRFYNNIGLIDYILPEDYKIIRPDETEELTPNWITARTMIINKLKEMWSINAPHKWYNKIDDEARLAEGNIDKATVASLKNMDIAYHSNIGADMDYNPKIKLQNSLTNLENWENNTVAIHPCVWNLVEKSYDSYIKILTISLFGEDILKKIYTNAFDWPLIHFGKDKTYMDGFAASDGDGLFSVKKNSRTNEDGQKVLESIQVHNVDYWKNTSHDLFSYTTDYEASTNEDAAHVFSSRFIDFDGPFNYEALMAIIDKYWDDLVDGEQADLVNGNKNSIRPSNINLSDYYIGNIIIQ